MSIYIFNLLVGYNPNGVDYAQGYRAKMIKGFSDSVKYIFTDLPERREIDFYKGLGVPVEQMLSIHQFFSGINTLKLSVKVEDKLNELKRNLNCVDVEYKGSSIRLIRDGFIVAEILVDGGDGECLFGIHYFERGNLVRTEVYTDRIFYTDYYVTAKAGERFFAKRVRRAFYNSDGSVVYNQIFHQKSGEYYLFSDGRICSKTEFIAEFVKRLKLTERDVVLLDRSAQFDFVQPLFQVGRKARLITVFHAGHYFEKGESASTTFLNWEYNYWFKYSKMIDTMVVSTLRQKEDLQEKLQEYHCAVPDILVIPAGGIERLRYPDGQRAEYSVVSVSRLHPQKRIDWIIRSIIKAHQVNPNVVLDIYGCGDNGYTKFLHNLVNENGARSYIRFRGHKEVTELYKNHEVFITASVKETLGLSVMEAIGSGMAVIGLDVEYGNRQFIHHGENGYLIDFDASHVDDNGVIERVIGDMAEKIVEIFSDKRRLEEFHRNSYKIAEKFLSNVMEEKWRELLM